MTWFTVWWNGLTLLQQGFAAVAIPATVILLLQTVLLLFGFDGHAADHGEGGDFDHDFDHDYDFIGEQSHALDAAGDHDHDFGHDSDPSPAHDGAHHGSGIRLFTVRGFVALFAVGGWLGLAMTDIGLGPVLSTLIACVGGFLALLATALVLYYSLRMQCSGNLNAANAVAHTATVYIPIPARRSGTGKVTMTLQEQFVEMDALCDSASPIPTGTMVQVVSVTDKGELIVRPMVNP